MHLTLKDSYFIEQLLLQQKIFFFDVFNSKRLSILLRLQFVRHIIFSLYIFLENIKYLNSCIKIIKFILLLNFKDSLRKDFTHQHNKCFN